MRVGQGRRMLHGKRIGAICVVGIAFAVFEIGMCAEVEQDVGGERLH